MYYFTRMKKYTVIVCAITAAALIVLAATRSIRQAATQTSGETYDSYYSLNAGVSQENAQNPSSFATDGSAASQAEKTAEESKPYVVTIYNGKIGVFEAGAAEPFLTADVEVYLLPEEDIEILRRGLSARTLKEVRSILEDYE